MKIMLKLKINENKNAIQFTFKKWATKEHEFQTAFDLSTAKNISKELIRLIKELKILQDE
jgi:hypothetical protein